MKIKIGYDVFDFDELSDSERPIYKCKEVDMYIFKVSEDEYMYCTFLSDGQIIRFFFTKNYFTVL